MMFSPDTFNTFLAVMAAVAVVVFFTLYRINAGYGKFYTPQWGPSVDNHLGWFLMEAPVFVAMLLLWWFSDRRTDEVRLVFLLFFESHYLHRSFIFPLQLRGHSRMPLSIIVMGAAFNTLMGISPVLPFLSAPLFLLPGCSSTYSPTRSSGISGSPETPRTTCPRGECSAM